MVPPTWSRYNGDSDLIPVSLVKEYAWCPAFAWLQWNGPPEPLPAHMETDYRPEPIEVSTMLEALGHKGHVVMEAKLKSDRLGVVGVVDFLAEPTGDSPGAVVEVKARGLWSGHERLQAALYALMAEEAYGAPFKAYILTKTSLEEVSGEDKARALRALRELKRALRRPKPPEPGHDMTRCRACPYKIVCPYPPTQP